MAEARGAVANLLTGKCPPSLRVAAVTKGLESISRKGAGGVERDASASWANESLLLHQINY